MRLKDRVAIVVGAGQSPGEGIGNGRATALTFAREGAKVLCVDHNLASAQETVDLIAAKEGTAAAFKADVTKNADLKAMVEDAQGRWGRIDILHNNVGVSLSGGDAELLDISEEAFDRCVAINLKSCVLGRQARDPDHAGAEERRDHQHLVDGRDHHLSLCGLQGDQVGDDRLHRTARLPERAIRHPRQRHPARPDEHADGGRYPRARIREEPRRSRGRARRKVPLRQKMGTGWDVANAALFLASDEASFITGVTLPVDGGASVRRG